MSAPIDLDAIVREMFPFGMWHDYPSGYERMIESNVELLAERLKLDDCPCGSDMQHWVGCLKCGRRLLR